MGTDKKKGFGFITFDSPDSAAKAVETMHGLELQGRTLTVKMATARGQVVEEGEADEDDEENDGFATATKKKVKFKPPSDFHARAAEKKQEGKVLGWGGGDGDWAQLLPGAYSPLRLADSWSSVQFVAPPSFVVLLPCAESMREALGRFKQ